MHGLVWPRVGWCGDRSLRPAWGQPREAGPFGRANGKCSMATRRLAPSALTLHEPIFGTGTLSNISDHTNANSTETRPPSVLTVFDPTEAVMWQISCDAIASIVLCYPHKLYLGPDMSNMFTNELEHHQHGKPQVG